MSSSPHSSVSPSGLIVEESLSGIRSQISIAQGQNRKIGLVPTMGALHQGHTSLIEAAKRACDFVVVSIFVNPTQFGPNEDLAKYPRTLEADLLACREAGADAVFVPSEAAVYPPGSTTFVEVAGLSQVLEGAVRPGHFRGVATIVLKLFHMIDPDIAFFGAKDFQQQLLIRRMVRDLDLPLEIAILPTVRETDGLAMSSRNRYLDQSERRRATAISAALFTARQSLLSGNRDLAEIQLEMRRSLEAAGLVVDYALACDPETLDELSEAQSSMVLLIAARLGAVRLIDNVEVTLQAF